MQRRHSAPRQFTEDAWEDGVDVAEGVAGLQIGVGGVLQRIDQQQSGQERLIPLASTSGRGRSTKEREGTTKGKALRSSNKESVGPRSLVNLCTGLLGRHLEELTDGLPVFAHLLPPSVKASLLAVARRQRLLCDNLLLALVDESWTLLDLSGGSAISESVLREAVKHCPRLVALDLSGCSQLSTRTFRTVVESCQDVACLRLGGTRIADEVVRQALPQILPRLEPTKETAAAADWEELDLKSVHKGADKLRCLIWPTIDAESLDLVAHCCPRVMINPRHRSMTQLPSYANVAEPLDAPFVSDLDADIWVVYESELGSKSSDSVVPIAERFRMAYVARDERLAPKRAKNRRQQARRAEKKWLTADIDAKARRMARMLQIEQ